MLSVREAWTDERLDDFRDDVNRRFDRVDHRFDEVDRRFDEVDRRFDEVDRRFQQVDQRFDRVEGDLRELRAETKGGFELLHARFDSLQRTMIISFAGIAASLIAAVLVNHL